ncbi:MAG: DUF2934 domain-containing protein [Verrucomicrobia bacterium]|nr:DUF2934 domain-containing protein [Verrucomicrobiota bacterium]
MVQGQPPEAAAWEPTAEAPEPVGQPKPLEEPTFEQIQLRAYFIAERRRTAGIAGNEESDWLQAKEELSNELRGH